MPIDLQQAIGKLVGLSRGYIAARAVHTVAKLGVANHLSSQPMKFTELAALTGTIPDLLARMIRYLSAYDIFHTDSDSCWQSELSLYLRDDHPLSLRDIICIVDDSWWQAFSNLDFSLKTGNAAFYDQHGEAFFDYLSEHPEKQQAYDKGMAKLSAFSDKELAERYDFSNYNHLVDLGGGLGGQSKALAARYPSLKITLFEKHALIEQLDPNDFPAEINLVAGNFLEELPEADAYLFKGVLHDFNDELVEQILRNCASQMPPSSSLFIAEQILNHEDPRPHPNKTLDMVTMVLLNGKQRTLSEWRKLVEPAGFKFENSYETHTFFTLLSFKKS